VNVTQAKISSLLLGLAYGLRGIPVDWLKKLTRQHDILRLSKKPAAA
jgi:hypothetical protein